VNEQLTQVPETIKHRTLAVSTLNYIISRNVKNFTPKKKEKHYFQRNFFCEGKWGIFLITQEYSIFKKDSSRLIN